MLTCPGRGAITDRRTISVDLDNETAQVFADNELIAADFTLEPTGFEVFDVTAGTVECDCRWHLEIDVIRAGETETVVVDDGGQPFRTSSSTNSLWYQFSDGEWVDVSAGGPGISIPDIPVPADAGDTCRHLPPELVADAVGPGWRQADGTGTTVTPSIGTGGEPMLAEDCTYLPADSGIATGLQLLRYADEDAAASELEAIAEQLQLTSTPVALETVVEAEVVDYGGMALLRCGPAILILQAPPGADLVTLVETAARSIDPDC